MKVWREGVIDNLTIWTMTDKWAGQIGQIGQTADVLTLGIVQSYTSKSVVFIIC